MNWQLVLAFYSQTATVISGAVELGEHVGRPQLLEVPDMGVLRGEFGIFRGEFGVLRLQDHPNADPDLHRSEIELLEQQADAEYDALLDEIEKRDDDLKSRLQEARLKLEDLHRTVGHRAA